MPFGCAAAPYPDMACTPAKPRPLKDQISLHLLKEVSYSSWLGEVEDAIIIEVSSDERTATAPVENRISWVMKRDGILHRGVRSWFA